MNFRERILGIIPPDWRYDLSRLPHVRSVLKSRWVPLLPVIFCLFLLTIVLISSFLGGFSAGNYNFAVTTVWILWWVLLMIFLVPFCARIWCTVCPFPLLGEWAQRGKLFGVGKTLSGLQLRWPDGLRNMWLMNILFILVSLGGGFFTVRPFWTFVLLGSMLVLATISMLVWEKRTFCLYICPVSGFQGLYANLSPLEIRRRDAGICRDHREKTCVSGNESGYGCPWGLPPFRFTSNTYCGMCLECFKTCPHDNMALNLRPPCTDLLSGNPRGFDEAWKVFIMLGVAASFFLLFQGPYPFLKDWASAKTLAGYSAFAFFHVFFASVLIPCMHLVFTMLSRVSSGNMDVSTRTVFLNFAYTLIPLGLSAWVAFSLGIILPNGSYVLHVLSDPFGLGWNLFGTANFPWTPVFTLCLQPLKGIALVAGFLFSMDAAYKISFQVFGSDPEAQRGVVPIFVWLLILTIFFLWMFTG